MARRKQARRRKTSTFDVLLFTALAWARNASAIRMENARMDLLRAQTVEKKYMMAERVMRIRVMNEQRKLIEVRRKAMENALDKPNTPLIGTGAVIGDCPSCGLTHSPHLNLTHCSECGTKLNSILLDV